MYSMDILEAFCSKPDKEEGVPCLGTVRSSNEMVL